MAEKKGLIQRFIVGKDRDENYARSTLPSNRWELLWDVIKGRFWKNVLLNLMLIVAFIPTIFILFRTSLLAPNTARCCLFRAVFLRVILLFPICLTYSMCTNCSYR